MHRRTFLHTAAIGAAAAAANPGRALAHTSDETLRVGLIGCGWYGGVLIKAAFEAGGVEVLAVCDVDSAHLANLVAEVESAQGRRPHAFADHRELLEVPGLQAVFIASPPQWHALQFIDACQKGLDIYCEKPLAYDVREGMAMVEAARRARNVVQIGFQRRQSEAVQQAADFIRAGRAGRIVQVDAQIHYNAQIRDTTVQEPPASLDWDAWCGPAPKLPYRPSIGHFAWRLEKEYGNGHLVDWGVHLIDAVRTTLGESTPKAVHAAGGIYQLRDRITTPDTLTVHFEFETCPVVWRHRIWGSAEYSPQVNNGVFFYGEDATVFTTDARWEVIPRATPNERVVHDVPTADRMQRRHVAEFLDAVRTRTPAGCDTEDGFHSTTTVQLGMIAYQAGGRVEWDRSRHEIVGNPQASALLRRPYRAPWRHPAAG
jgi:predicted dehydrogenase